MSTAPATGHAGVFLTPGHGQASEAIKEVLTWPQWSFQPPVPLTGLPVCGGTTIDLLPPYLNKDMRHMGGTHQPKSCGSHLQLDGG